MTLTLFDLFEHFPMAFQVNEALPHVPVHAIVFDSRQVQPGDVFVALKGVSVDGHRFIQDAAEKGAIAAVGMQTLEKVSIPYICVEDTRPALAHLCAAFYGNPARKLTVIGVTGTDGKTTTSNLIYQILLATGHRAGIISTVNAVIGDEVIDTGFHTTTPDAPDTQRYLAQMVAAGLTHVVLESTSHGLSQHRVTGCEFDIGVVTNITHEHLDYHKTYEEYRAAKGRLFTMLAETPEKLQGNPRLAVLNRDDSSYDYLHELARVRQVAYSLYPGVDVWPEDVKLLSEGMSFVAVGKNFRQPTSSTLVGDYNISNILAAFSASVFGLGISPEVAARGIAALPGVPGRMEHIDLGQNFTAIVDFAHTPNALEVTLKTARQLTRGRVIAVFGSAGLRDREKRRMMAQVSIHMADVTVLTAEDPRTESLDDILAEMADAAVKEGGIEGDDFFRVPDRGDAIRKGLQLARSGDLVIACGKGHEQSMCFDTVEYPWDDRIAMRAALAELLGIKGETMPALPTSK
jgi:UDP-N-acetylmuramoyl-L-alanyl-D-glutamate--2,6-diaminopimelate ligase